MRRQSHQDVQAAARRRLELLGRELEQAGLRRVDDPVAGVDEEGADGGVPDPAGLPPELPEPTVVEPVGRHLRPPRAGVLRRLGGWVADQLPETLRGRSVLETGPVLLVVGLVAAALLATTVVVLRMGGDAEAVPGQGSLGRSAGESTGKSTGTPSSPLASLAPAPGMPSGVPGTTGGTPGAGDPASSSASSSGTVTVDVAGKVRRPGVRTLPGGSRVVDALEKAGGARTGVDLSGLNLARVLVDGEQILVGRAAEPGGVAAGAAASAPPPTGALLDLNTATLEQLDTLPGVGPVTAAKILSWRTAHGAFSSVDELLEVDGIGEKTLADLAPLVTL